MKKWSKYSATFLILSLVFCIGLGICIGLFDKPTMHLWLNGTHTAFGDFFFRYYTYVGEWVPYVVVALLLFYKAGWASFLLADVAISGLFSQGLKYWADTDRPYSYFAQHMPDVQLQFVDGVTLSKWYSFPSGHTTTFFALFFTLAILLCEIRDTNTGISRRSTDGRNFCLYTLINLFCFVLAVLGGYSRIYLNQHFAEDILGGAAIGILTTIGLLFAVPKLEPTAFWNWNLLQIRSKMSHHE